jgi:hypothetical protein
MSVCTATAGYPSTSALKSDICLLLQQSLNDSQAAQSIEDYSRSMSLHACSKVLQLHVTCDQAGRTVGSTAAALKIAIWLKQTLDPADNVGGPPTG